MAAKAVQRPTFADLVREPTWSETDAARSGRYAPTSGRFNRVGDLYDLDLRSHELAPEPAEGRTDLDAVVDGRRPVAGGLAKCRNKLTKLLQRWDMLINCTASPLEATQAGVILSPMTCYGLGALGRFLAVKWFLTPGSAKGAPGSHLRV